MSKDRYAVICNGRTSFYACMWEDIRQCAMGCGWAVALHGSLASDMDIMAMPWVENSTSFKDMVDKISKLFKDNDVSSQYVITYNEKPHNRVVATIPIFADFYLDISTILKGDEYNERPCEMFKNKADFVEVVRCKDCCHYIEIKGFDYNGRKARSCVWHSALRGENDYCSDAIRKTRTQKEG